MEADTSAGDTEQTIFRLLQEITDLQELTKPLLQHFIERIEVEQGWFEKNSDGQKVKKQKIRIYYRFNGCKEEETAE